LHFVSEALEQIVLDGFDHLVVALTVRGIGVAEAKEVLV